MTTLSSKQVCRVTLGCSLGARTVLDLIKCARNRDPSVFNSRSGQRELVDVPSSSPAVPFHSLLAAPPQTGLRFAEYIVFHGEQTYPEYLVAYHRRK